MTKITEPMTLCDNCPFLRYISCMGADEVECLAGYHNVRGRLPESKYNFHDSAASSDCQLQPLQLANQVFIPQKNQPFEHY